MTSPNEVLQHPQREIVRDQTGRIVSVYVRLRTGKAVSAVQPNRSRQVFFELGSDKLPIGITFLEPAAGIAVSVLYEYLYQTPDGSPGGVGKSFKHFFFTSEQMKEIVNELDQAALQLQPGR